MVGWVRACVGERGGRECFSESLTVAGVDVAGELPGKLGLPLVGTLSDRDPVLEGGDLLVGASDAVRGGMGKEGVWMGRMIER